MIRLSIIIPSLNEQDEIVKTVESIRATSPSDVEIVVIDDRSIERVVIPEKFHVKRHRNLRRVGVAKSRHLGAEMATGKYLLFLDGHMRCEPGWYEKAMERITLPGRERTVHCGCCLGLGFHAEMDLKKNFSEYCGADLHLYHSGDNSVFCSKWLAGPVDDDAEISSVMGAIYFVPRDFFFHIGGLNSLKFYGDDEPFLSLKAWLAGGECRLVKGVRIGHKFRNESPYRTPVADMIYNKIRALKVLCPEFAEDLEARIPAHENKTEAQKMILKDSDEIAEERQRYASIFVRDIWWFLDKFKKPDPRQLSHEPMDLEKIFRTACSTKSDINEHLEYISRISSLGDYSVEFGVRNGLSTLALIWSGCRLVRSYDVSSFPRAQEYRDMASSRGVSFDFCKESSLEVEIPECDFLLIDSLHTADQLKKELALHHEKVKGYIAMHDTATGTFGDRSEDGTSPGLWNSIRDFLKSHREWELFSHHNHNNGLTVLKRK